MRPSTSTIHQHSTHHWGLRGVGLIITITLHLGVMVALLNWDKFTRPPLEKTHNIEVRIIPAPPELAKVPAPKPPIKKPPQPPRPPKPLPEPNLPLPPLTPLTPALNDSVHNPIEETAKQSPKQERDPDAEGAGECAPINPTYPESARAEGWESVVTIRFRVDEDGRVRSLIGVNYGKIPKKGHSLFLTELEKILPQFLCRVSPEQEVLEWSIDFSPTPKPPPNSPPSTNATPSAAS